MADYSRAKQEYDALVSKKPEECPDGGTCHHTCQRACFRVQSCDPLSGVYEDDQWPDEVLLENHVTPKGKPSDAVIRFNYGGRRVPGDIKRLREFDEWLSERDRALSEQIWDRAYATGAVDTLYSPKYATENPFRK